MIVDSIKNIDIYYSKIVILLKYYNIIKKNNIINNIIL